MAKKFLVMLVGLVCLGSLTAAAAPCNGTL
jgi:hypothetical protein